MENESVNQWLDAASVRSLAEGLMKPAPSVPRMKPETIYGSGFVGFAESAPIPASAPVKPEGSIRVEPEVSSFAPVPTGMESSKEVVPKEVVPKEVVPKEVVPKEVVPKEVVPKEVKSQEIVPEEPSRQVEVTLTPTGKRVDDHSARIVARYPSPFKIATDPPKAPAPARQEHPASAQGQSLAKRLSIFGVWLKGENPAEAYFICNRNGEVVVDEIGSSKLIKVACTLALASAGTRRQFGESGDASGLHVKVSNDRFLEVVPSQCQFGLVILGILVPSPFSEETLTSIGRRFTAALDEK